MRQLFCRTYRCTLSERACLARQESRFRCGKAIVVPVSFRGCSGCIQGRHLRERLEALGRLAAMLADLEESRRWHKRRTRQNLMALLAARRAAKNTDAYGVRP